MDQTEQQDLLAVFHKLKNIEHQQIGLLRQQSRRAEPPAAPRTTLARAVTVMLLAELGARNPAELATELFGEDKAVAKALANPGDFLVRASTNPAMTATPSWASELVGHTFTTPLSILAPASAYAALGRRGQSLSLPQGVGSIRLVGRTAVSEVAGGFIGEAGAIAVRRASLIGAVVVAMKLAVITEFTRELAQQSPQDIVGLLEDMIAADTAKAVDGALLDTSAGSAVRPSGLLYGVTPLAATAGGGADALGGDVSKLGIAVPQASPLTLVMTSAMRDRALLISAGMASLDVVAAPFLTEGTLIGLDASDFASVESTPAFDISEAASVHEEDTTPLPVSTGTAGAAALTAAPVRSLWQTSVYGLRMLADTGWAMRRPARIAVINNVSW